MQARGVAAGAAALMQRGTHVLPVAAPALPYANAEGEMNTVVWHCRVWTFVEQQPSVQSTNIRDAATRAACF